MTGIHLIKVIERTLNQYLIQWIRLSM